MVVILMGGAGSGVTMIGRALSAELGWPCVDDEGRSASATMARRHSGLPLIDTDRSAWLLALHDTIAAALDRREHLVVTCPILKDAHREALRGALRCVRFVFLTAGDENPGDGLIVDATWPPERILGSIRYEFAL